MMSLGKRDYMFLVDRLSPCFASQGWSDGYFDLPDDSETIVSQLYGKISNDALIDCVNLYLQGYEVGVDMSENIEEVYDEDGEMVDNYDPSPMFDYKEKAIEYIKKYIENV